MYFVLLLHFFSRLHLDNDFGILCVKNSVIKENPIW